MAQCSCLSGHSSTTFFRCSLLGAALQCPANGQRKRPLRVLYWMPGKQKREAICSQDSKTCLSKVSSNLGMHHHCHEVPLVVHINRYISSICICSLELPASSCWSCPWKLQGAIFTATGHTLSENVKVNSPNERRQPTHPQRFMGPQKRLFWDC